MAFPHELSSIRRRVVVTGTVQGVSFRESCRAEAMKRGAAGYVQNLADGSVLAVFEGAPEIVNALIEWCRQGPRWARVDAVSVSAEVPTGERGFMVHRTA